MWVILQLPVCPGSASAWAMSILVSAVRQYYTDAHPAAPSSTSTKTPACNNIGGMAEWLTILHHSKKVLDSIRRTLHVHLSV